MGTRILRGTRSIPGYSTSRSTPFHTDVPNGKSLAIGSRRPFSDDEDYREWPFFAPLNGPADRVSSHRTGIDEPNLHKLILQSLPVKPVVTHACGCFGRMENAGLGIQISDAEGSPGNSKS